MSNENNVRYESAYDIIFHGEEVKNWNAAVKKWTRDFQVACVRYCPTARESWLHGGGELLEILGMDGWRGAAISDDAKPQAITELRKAWLESGGHKNEFHVVDQKSFRVCAVTQAICLNEQAGEQA